VPTEIVLSRRAAVVKAELSAQLTTLAEELVTAAATGASARSLELGTLKSLMELGLLLLAALFAVRCERAMLSVMERRGHDPDTARVRTDADYFLTLTTTLGPVRFPVYAYRYPAAVGTTTHADARTEVFPLVPRCRSSELCLAWESRLASLHPFRKAQNLMTFFTHGEVALEDTTIARHAVRVGHVIDQRWLYQAPDEFRRILEERATRDARTNRPIVYLSSDAHALRRYVNESWADQWKMINGLRVWCVDKDRGTIIHIGGQFTCGDAAYLRDVVRQLIASGYLPANGDFGDGLVATYVFVADGMPWIAQHLISQFPDVIAILDAYHVLERLAEYARTRFRQGSIQAREFYEQAKRLLFGPPAEASTPRSYGPRKGHKKGKKVVRATTANLSVLTPERTPAGEALLEHLETLDDKSECHKQLVNYVVENVHRMDYVMYRASGLQIGSGAMESLHRTGSQARLKRAGARWLPETLEAMFNLRMLELAGRWDEFFAQPDLWQRLAHRFVDTAYVICHLPRAVE
jgi:hypothetical protein